MSMKLQHQGVILIVDDNPANLGVLSDFLDIAGFEVWIAKSGDMSLERVKFALPDLILLDVMMPGINGFETCRQLKSNPETENIPVIFMTALCNTENKVKGLNLGAVDYVTKPFEQEEVLARVKLHLKVHHLTKKVEEQNQVLEKRVSERTAELDKTLQELKRAQTHLIQSEKMSSLGQLVAGVAHEINNPTNFIFGNLVHAQEYTQSLLEVLTLYQQEHNQPSPKLAQKMLELDLDFAVEDLPKTIKSMQVGAERIREIVLSLRNFSHMDEAEIKNVDIHEGINNTLMILQNRLKSQQSYANIEVIRDYDQLPAVECYPGQLNQVFMNILANAIDAIEERLGLDNDISEKPQIRIHTQLINSNWLEVAISDNGIGIKQDLVNKLFNPFFTTKPIGKGTGMGLAISYSIVVEKHGGKIVCYSQPKQGTKVIIKIPLQQLQHQSSLNPALVVNHPHQFAVAS
ncbi:MAG: response regulator [Spirulinaceae cyanobacterium]